MKHFPKLILIPLALLLLLVLFLRMNTADTVSSSQIETVSFIPTTPFSEFQNIECPSLITLMLVNETTITDVVFNDLGFKDTASYTRILSPHNAIGAVKVATDGSIETRLINLMVTPAGVKRTLEMKDIISVDQVGCNVSLYSEK